MNTKTHVYEETYREYLGQIAAIDFGPLADILGVKVEIDKITIPFLGRPHLVYEKSIIAPSGKQPPFGVCVVLCKYLLLCPDTASSENDWTAYRDFKDSGPLTVFFANSVEKSISKHFAGRLTALEDSCRALGGVAPDIAPAYDLCVQFNALPKIPILLLFNDADDEFPAHCSMLFQRRAEKYLDAESLAILGDVVAGLLINKSN